MIVQTSQRFFCRVSAKSNGSYWICSINTPKWTLSKYEALFTHIISWTWERFFNRDPTFKSTF